MQKQKRKYVIRESPFINIGGNLKVQIQEVKTLEGDLSIVKKKYYQSSEYTKIITNDKIDLSLYFNLSPAAKDLLFYVITLLEYNSPTFTLKTKDAMVVLKLTSKSYIYKIIKELIDSKYVARTGIKEVYWINHNRYYKGNYTFDMYAQNNKK